MTNACKLAVVAAFLQMCPPATARAADEDPATLVHQGIDLYRHEDYEGARDAFARAYDLSPTARTLFNLALAEFQSGHVVESIRHMRAYLADLDAEREKVDVLTTKWLPRAEAQTSRLKLDAPDGAEVLIDGIATGHAPLDTIDVGIGDHDVVARSGTWLHSEHVVLRPGELLLVRFERPASARALVSVADVPAPGRNASVLSRVPPGKLATEIGLVSGAAVATGLGATFAFLSYDEASQASLLRSQLPPDPSHSQCTGSTPPPQCAPLHAHNQNLQNDHTLSAAFYVGAGLLAGAALVTWFAWPLQPSAPAVRVAPLSGVGRTGLSVEGSW